MSDELSVVENVVEEVLIDLMTERVMSMSTGIQASSMRGFPASPSTAHGAEPSWSSDEKRTKHMDDLVNAKLISTILSTYIPPLRQCAQRFQIHLGYGVPPKGDTRSLIRPR